MDCGDLYITAAKQPIHYHDKIQPNRVILKMDFTNALNYIQLDKLLSQVSDLVP